jgi:hypothetical protein
MSSTFVSLIIQLSLGAADSGLLAKFVSQVNPGPIGSLVTGCHIAHKPSPGE